MAEWKEIMIAFEVQPGWAMKSNTIVTTENQRSFLAADGGCQYMPKYGIYVDERTLGDEVLKTYMPPIGWQVVIIKTTDGEEAEETIWMSSDGRIKVALKDCVEEIRQSSTEEHPNLISTEPPQASVVPQETKGRSPWIITGVLMGFGFIYWLYRKGI
jgi:hypothetical protein